MNMGNQVMNFNMVNQPQMQGLVAGNANPTLIPYDQVGYYIPYQQQMIQWVAIPQPYPQRQNIEFIHPQVYSKEQMIQSQQQAKLYQQYIDGQNQWTNPPKPKVTKAAKTQNVSNTQKIQQPQTQQRPQQQPEQVLQREFSPALFGADKAPPQCFDIIGRGNLPSINFSTVYSAK
ncbi:hypothetical protein GPJ56_000604 [Histomonas meleagridis]|uniref:uncharacterized protein n=1 Tax=Histomonas meleagridis TaxID=135588 RepID=UPI003559C4D7|nr:hypothetical protein GPJ56_000604 [Histomonas meleagridis]KAH0804732.1 hypothetical protein GO595_002426 [Histomonas meleagridis]